MAYAYVTVKMKVTCSSNWSENTTIAQVSRQAKEDALGQIRNNFDGKNYTIIGEPEVTAVHTDISPNTLPPKKPE